MEGKKQEHRVSGKCDDASQLFVHVRIGSLRQELRKYLDPTYNKSQDGNIYSTDTKPLFVSLSQADFGIEA